MSQLFQVLDATLRLFVEYLGATKPYRLQPCVDRSQRRQSYCRFDLRALLVVNEIDGAALADEHVSLSR